jgi:hypothetical protein
MFVCRAFPNGIPWGIVTGKVKHTEVLPGQVGDYVLDPGSENSHAPPASGGKS